MAMIVVIAVMAGFESDLKQRIMGIRPHMVITNKTGDVANYQQLIRQLPPTAGIETASAFISTQVLLRTNSHVAGAFMKGVQVTAHASGISGVDTQQLVPPADTADTTKHQNKKPSPPRIIIGKELAANLGVIRGDTVYIISPRGMLAPIGHMPAMVKFQVVDLFESGMYELDGTLCFVNLIQAQRMLKTPNSVNGIEIRVNNIDHASQIARTIDASIGSEHYVKDWKQLDPNLFSALRLEKTVWFIILALIVLVAAFNIAGSLVMMVTEKKKDIAILKAMGATSRSIGRIFVIKGLMIGLMGITLGTSAGVGLCMLLKRYEFIHLPADVLVGSTLPVNLNISDVLLIAVSALLICMAAALYPARRAAAVNPVEAIHHG